MPKVADFGLARVVQDDDATMRKTRSGIAMGTPRYMSPEQIRDAKNVDQRTDIFALGAILYELVCGEAAFERGDIAAIFNATLSGSYKSPASLAPGVPERVLRAIDSSLKTNKEQRIPDCATFRAVLDGQVYAPPKASAPATEASVPRVQKTRVSADTIDVGPASGRPVHTSAPSMIGAAVVGGGVVAAVIGVVALIGLGIGIWYMRSGMPPTDVVAAVPGAASTEAPEAPSGEVAERGESTSGSTSTGAANGSATPATAGTSPSGKSTGTGSAKPAATPVEPSVPAELPSAASAASAAAPEEKPAETKPESAPKAEPAEAPRAVPKPPATKPVPVAEAVSENATVGARVSYSGDATKVWLVGSDGRRVARGVVPAGRYDIEADFGDGERTPAGELDLKVGDEVALKCSKSFRRCK
jgi:serine/threonine-protein kinase